VTWSGAPLAHPSGISPYSAISPKPSCLTCLFLLAPQEGQMGKDVHGPPPRQHQAVMLGQQGHPGQCQAWERKEGVCPRCSHAHW
jgi:hypothetical protein